MRSGRAVLARVGALGATASLVFGAAIAPAGAVDNRPARHISGTATGLDRPYGVARDSQGRLYVANLETNAVLVFAKGATGNSKPVFKIRGSDTRLDGPDDVAFDSAGRLIVVNHYANRLTVYKPGARGNVKPVRIISGYNTTLQYPTGVFVDKADRMWVSNGGDENSLLMFATGAKGNVPPVRKIRGSNTHLSMPWDIALDSRGRIYTIDADLDRVFVYGAKANGNVGPIRTFGAGYVFFVGALAIDAKDRVYVANGPGSASNGAGTLVSMWLAGANGNTPPSKVLRGKSSYAGSASGSGLALDRSGNLYVSVNNDAIDPFGTTVAAVDKYRALTG